MRMLFASIAIAVFCIGLSPASAQACYYYCAGTNGNAANTDPPCSLRTSGPLSKTDIEEASKLLAELTSAQETMRSFRDVSSAIKVGIYYSAPNGSNGYCYNCASNTIELGTIADVRDMINAIYKGRIEKSACRLRSLGVDIPKP